MNILKKCKSDYSFLSIISHTKKLSKTLKSKWSYNFRYYAQIS